MSKHLSSLLASSLLCACALPGNAATNTNWFKIVSLTTSNAVLVDAALAGNLAASADHLFASRVGSSDFRRWDAGGFANPTNIEPGFIVVSDLRTEKVYAFANDDGTMTGSGTATALHELNPATGQTNGAVIMLSESVPVEDTCSPEFGIFCGWGRVVVGSSRLRDIALPSGQVTLLPVGTSNPFDQWCDPPEPLTGIAEFFGEELYLVACQPFSGGKIERVRLSDSTRTTVATFSDMPRNTKIGFSPSRNRWYFSTETSWLGSNSEAIGYADATWDQSDEFPQPPALSVTMPAEVTQFEDTTSTNVFGSFSQRENAGLTWMRVVHSSNPALLPTNAVNIAGGGFFGNDAAGSFQFTLNPLPDQFGTATLTFLTTNNVGERATNFLTATVLPVDDDWPTVRFLFEHEGVKSQTRVLVPPLHVDARPVRLTNYFKATDPDQHSTPLVFTFETSDPVNLPTNRMFVLPAGTNFQMVFEVPPGRFCYDQLVRLVATDETGRSDSLWLAFQIMPTGIRPAGTVTNTDYRVYALAGLRDWVAGTPLTVTGLVGQVRQSWLYVHSAIMPTFPTLRGVNLGASGRIAEVVGVAADSCETTNRSFLTRFDVTDLVHSNGVYFLGNLFEGAAGEVFRTVNGVSLLVCYDDGDDSNNVDLTLYHGNDSNEDGLYDPTGWQTLLSDLVYAGGTAKLGLHVAYGEALPEAPIAINGLLWQAQTNHFDGLSVPKVSSEALALWDVVEFDLAPQLLPGTNQLLFTSNRTTNTQDCVNLCLATVTQPAARPQRPTLTLRRAENQQIEISWSPAMPGFTLQSADSLSPTNWVNAPSGASNPIVVPATSPTKFYRLFKP
jgi:hypothetical protein